ncbi:MAG: hypothetical protein IJI36_08660 [Kiritimatiellae bacterium]|nr:hypothetical protein [Kiritimatiellia bacterium]
MKSNWLAHARLLLGGILLLAAGTLALRARHGVETDLYALADTAHGGVLRELATGMAGQGRVLLEGNDFEVLKAEAESIRARFRQPTGDFKDTLKFIGAHRAGLLSPETREQLTAGRYKDVADAALARLYGFLPPLVSVKEDPFLLATDWLLALQTRRTAGWTLRDGLLARETNGVQQVLLTLDLSAIRPREIANFLEAVAKPRCSVRDDDGTPSLPGSSLEIRTNLDIEAPGIRHQALAWCGGPPFHAARATANATREINVLSAFSLALVLLFGWQLFRSFRFVPQLVATLGAAFLVAAAALFAVFPRPHVLTFVFGTSLIGLAVDYAYHVRAAGGARAVLRPLALSLLTTEACFAPLLFSVAPVLRQMALFTGTGLLSAFAWAIIWGWRGDKIREACRLSDGMSVSDGSVKSGWAALTPLRILLVAVAACGLYRVRMSSDPASFYVPDRYLAESEKRLAVCSPAETGRFVFVRGRTVQEALAREEASGVQGLSAIVPSLARQRENATLIAKLYAAEGTNYGAKTGLRVTQPSKGDLLDPEKIDDPHLAQLVRAMTVGGGIVSPCPEGFATDDPNIVVLEPKRAVSDLFAAFSSATMTLLGWSLAVLATLLALVFGRRFVGYVASLAATFAATAGMLGWLGVPVTFFTLLCFFAVAGLGLDYAIFSRSQSTPGARRTVFFAFLTSFAGLGMLALTDFAVTRAMGVTFACGLFFAWICAGLFAGGRGTNSHAGRVTLPGGPNPKGNAQDVKYQAQAWHQQREQSAGRWRMLFMWYAYAWFGKMFQKLVCVPVMAFIYPFARPAREALREFYRTLDAFKGLNKAGGASPFTLFAHLLGFAWSLADKTDACTLRKNLPRMTVRDDAGWRAFDALVKAKKGAFLLSTHLGTIEVFPALGGTAPHVHAFQQMGHDAVFTEVFARHLDASRLTLHPVEENGVETAVQMQEAIGRGEFVLMAGDRVSAGSKRMLRHDFLGRPCAWPKGAFAFAKLMEAPIFFVTCVRTGWNAYEVHVQEFVPSEGPFLPSLLDAYVRFLETETLACPGQWYQFYRFFSPIAP